MSPDIYVNEIMYERSKNIEKKKVKILCYQKGKIKINYTKNKFKIYVVFNKNFKSKSKE